jgi:hypothetical protein
MDFQAGGNKIKAQRNEIQIRCNRIQIPRNRIQMPFPSTNACFSIGYPGFRQAPTPCGPVAGRPGADVQPGSTFGADGGVTFRKTKYLFGVWQENVDFSTKVDFYAPGQWATHSISTSPPATPPALAVRSTISPNSTRRRVESNGEMRRLDRPAREGRLRPCGRVGRDRSEFASGELQFLA